jgi:hypothetical protein
VLRIRECLCRISRIWIFPSWIPDSGSKKFRIPDSDPHQRIFNPKTDSKLPEKLSWMFIPDPDFSPSPIRILDPVKKASATQVTTVFQIPVLWNPRIRIRPLTSLNAVLGQLFLISIRRIILQCFISYINYIGLFYLKFYLSE